jgi:hypothetical protein
MRRFQNAAARRGQDFEMGSYYFTLFWKNYKKNQNIAPFPPKPGQGLPKSGAALRSPPGGGRGT